MPRTRGQVANQPEVRSPVGMCAHTTALLRYLVPCPISISTDGNNLVRPISQAKPWMTGLILGSTFCYIIGLNYNH